MSENGHVNLSTNGSSANGRVNAAGEVKFSYGGQAVIEGVLMRGAHNAAIAVRNPKGEIVVHEQALNATLYRGRISKTPFVRGVIGLWDALGLGTRALMWSADVAVQEEDEAEKINFNGPIGWVTIAVSLAFGVGLFFLLPAAGSSWVGHLLGIVTDGAAPVGLNSFLVNLIEGLIRLALLVGYIWAIGRIPDVKRLFAYHGAEHKTINAYEAGADLTPEIVATYSIEHPRCGTGFLLTVVLVSILVFSLLGRPPFLLLLVSRILLIPVIAGIAYEFIRWTSRNMNRPWVRLIVRPNLALQHLTTRQPELHMIEVAIVSFKHVLASEGMLAREEIVIPEPRPEAVSPTLAGLKTEAKA